MSYNTSHMKLFDTPHAYNGIAAGVSLLIGCVALGGAFVTASSSADASGMQTASPAELIPASIPPFQWATISASTSISSLFAPSTRSISARSIADAIPPHGKLIAADLVDMKLYLYRDGTSTAVYPILTKGRPGSPYETPGGTYQILTRETDHFNKAEHVHMPYSMQFYGNYFIHGWPTYADGTPVSSTYSGGCIRLSTSDAALVYTFAARGTEVFVYDTGTGTSTPSIPLGAIPFPQVSASAYLVADIDSGDIYAAHDEHTQRPIASLTWRWLRPRSQA